MIIITRLSKCAYCEVKDTREKTKINNKNVHNECLKDYQIQQKQKAIENQQWSDLYEYLKVLHNAIEVPSFNIKRIKDLKKNKNITYKLIFDAYKIAEETITWFIKNVLHDSNTAKDMDACITLMIKHGLNKAYQDEQLQKKREQEIAFLKEDKTYNETTSEFMYKSKSSSNDISEFL